MFKVVLMAVLALAPSPDARPAKAAEAFARGHMAVAEKDYRAAARWWRQAITLDPTYWEAHAELAACLLQQSKANEALPHAEEAARLSPENARVKGVLEKVRAQLKATEAAIAAPLGEYERRFVGGDPAREAWLRKFRASLPPGAKLNLKPEPRGLSSADVAYLRHARRAYEASDEYSANADTADYDPVSGNFYQLSRESGRTVLIGSNLRTGARWENIYEADGRQYGRDKDGGEWVWDPNTEVYRHSNGLVCVGSGSSRQCAKTR